MPGILYSKISDEVMRWEGGTEKAVYDPAAPSPKVEA